MGEYCNCTDFELSGPAYHISQRIYTVRESTQEKSLLTEVFPSWFFLSTLATANSKSSCVTCCRRSRRAYMPCVKYKHQPNEVEYRDHIPASVHIPRTSAPDH